MIFQFDLGDAQMKKNSNIIFRVSDQERDAWHEYADAVGVPLSDLIRMMVKREVETKGLLQVMRPELIKGDSVYQQSARIRDAKGKLWRVYLISDDVFAYFNLHEEDPAKSFVDTLVSPNVLPKEPLGSFFNTYRANGSMEYDWDDNDFIRLIDFFGFNIDSIKPRYRNMDKKLVTALKDFIKNEISPHEMDRLLFAMDVLKVLNLAHYTRVCDIQKLHYQFFKNQRLSADPLLVSAFERIQMRNSVISQKRTRQFEN